MSTTFRVAWLLARRSIQHANIFTSIFIVTVMMLTFLNLIFVGGILIGMPAGLSIAFNKQYTGDILISALQGRSYIDESQNIIEKIRSTPGVVGMATRYLTSGTIRADYRDSLVGDQKPDEVIAEIAGINVIAESKLSNLDDNLIEGTYLNSFDRDYILIGSALLEEYSLGEIAGFQTIKNVKVGDKLLLSIGPIDRVVTVKGIIDSKVREVMQRIYMPERELRQLIGRSDFNVDEIAVRLSSDVSSEEIRDKFISQGIGTFAQVQTSVQAQGQLIEDIKITFRVLGDIIGSIGLIVGSITLFIVIFINAIFRRKNIGILKGIGISGLSIEISYVMQAAFYSLFGVFLGVILLYTILVPYFSSHPIDFPLSDGILVASFDDVIPRALLLFVMSLVAGYVPSHIIVRRNALDSILGRK